MFLLPHLKKGTNRPHPVHASHPGHHAIQKIRNGEFGKPKRLPVPTFPSYVGPQKKTLNRGGEKKKVFGGEREKKKVCSWTKTSVSVSGELLPGKEEKNRK